LTLNLQTKYVSESPVSKKGISEMKYEYARVSSKAQDYTAQVEALKAAGCEKIYSEKQSAKSTDGRPEFAKLMKALLPGDTVVVTKLVRLARSSRDLHNILHELEGLSVGFRSLGEAWCDTTTDVGRLMLTIMGGIAEFERSLIRSRTDAGIERARRQGKKFGRPARLDDGQKRKIAEFYAAGKTIPELAEEYGCGVGTIWRALQPETKEAA
jgi:DNA invertase Pin-like site-specific DNA recombinase